MKTITIEFPQGKHIEGMIDVVSKDFGLHYADCVTHDGLQCNYTEDDEKYHMIYILCKSIANSASEIVRLNSEPNPERSVATEDAQGDVSDSQEIIINADSEKEDEREDFEKYEDEMWKELVDDYDVIDKGSYGYASLINKLKSKYHLTRKEQ